MNGKRAKIIRKTCKLLFNNKRYMSQYPNGFTERDLYKYIKGQYNAN